MNVPIRRNTLNVDFGISELLAKQEQSSATEGEVRNLLRRYSTKDCLKAFSSLAKGIFNDPDLPGRQNPCILIDEKTGIAVTQFALSYLSSIAILSGGNDYKQPLLKANKDNVLGMCQIYNNCLPAASNDLSLPDEIKLHGPAPFLIRMNEEQFSYQISGHDMFARTFVLYQEIAPMIFGKGFEALDIVHQRETGLSVEDFLWIAFGFFAIGLQYTNFRASQLYDANIQALKHIYTQSKVDSFLALMAVSYSRFREYDDLMNRCMPLIGTKSRFNPLVVYPIVSMQIPENGNPYIIPNQVAYIRRSTEGIFWWFDTVFENHDGLGRGEFRSYFGNVFQDYVGRILAAIYGEHIVMPEFQYGTKKEPKAFSDWWLIKNNKLYLFEVKAHQINLHNRRVTDIDKFKSEEVLKVAQAVKQLFKVTQDIRNGRVGNSRIRSDIEIIPVAVFYDVPFVAEISLYGNWLKEALQKLENESAELAGLSEFKVFPVNIAELEPYESISDCIELEEILVQNDSNGISSNISSTMSALAKTKGRSPNSLFLDKAYHRLFDRKSVS